MIRTCFLLFLILLVYAGCSKSEGINHNNPYGLNIVNNIDEYRKQISINPDFELWDISEKIPEIVLDIRYATQNNFTGKVIYTLPKAFVRKKVVEALVMVQDSLKKLNLGLKIFDAYRPYAATLLFYEVYPDTNFVANPRYGSRHNRGCAVDVSLVDVFTGLEISMPTPFDEFSERAHPEYMNLEEEVIANRTLLFGVMQHFGFTHYPTEWWHFDFEGWEKYPLMDIPFEKLLSGNPQIQ